MPCVMLRIVAGPAGCAWFLVYHGLLYCCNTLTPFCRLRTMRRYLVRLRRRCSAARRPWVAFWTCTSTIRRTSTPSLASRQDSTLKQRCLCSRVVQLWLINARRWAIHRLCTPLTTACVCSFIRLTTTHTYPACPTSTQYHAYNACPARTVTTWPRSSDTWSRFMSAASPWPSFLSSTKRCGLWLRSPWALLGL